MTALNIDNLGDSPIAPDSPEAALLREMYGQDITSLMQQHQDRVMEVERNYYHQRDDLYKAYHKIAPWLFEGEEGTNEPTQLP